jgi:hypothetical protein
MDVVYPSDAWQQRYMRELADQIAQWKQEYYYGNNTVDDATYDLWWRNLLHLEGKYPHLKDPISPTINPGAPMHVDFSKVQKTIDYHTKATNPLLNIKDPYTMHMDFNKVSEKIFKAQDKAMEEYLLEYFGSAEEAIESAKYFTLETSDLIFKSDTSVGSDEFKLETTVIYRVRVKTAEELRRTGVLEPWPEVIITMQKLEIEREALIAKDYDDALTRAKGDK